MRHRFWLIGILALLLTSFLAAAQDSLNLPTELYVLLNSGVVQRIGLGAEGIRNVTPDGEFVLDFGVAPDGNWVAYRTQQTGLTLVNMFVEGSQTTLDGTSAGVPPIRGQGDTMAWTPQGDALAYTTLNGLRVYFNSGVFADIQNAPFLDLSWSSDGHYLAAGAENHIWWIYRREGTQLVLTSAITSSVGLAWISPTELVFAPIDGGLIIMNLAKGNAQTALEDNTWFYRMPYSLPDGTLLVYGKKKDDTTLDDKSARLLLVTLETKQVKALGQSAVDLTDARWTPGGDQLFALHGGTLAVVNRTTGEGFSLPINSIAAYSWGPAYPPTVTGIQMPINAFFLAKDLNNITQVWRLPRDGSAPSTLTPATEDITDYAISPRERSVAYVSGGKLWLLSLVSSSEPVALAQSDNPIIQPAFSTDGRTVAYVIAGGSQGGIWRVPTTGGDPERLTTDGDNGTPPFYRQPTFAPNINALLFVIAQSEITNIGLMDLTTKDITNIGGYDAAIWLSDGRIGAYGTGVGIGSPPPFQNIFLINPNSPAAPTKVAGIPAPLLTRSLTGITRSRLRAAVSSTVLGPAPLSVVEIPAAGGDTKNIADMGFLVAPQFSPDGSLVAGFSHPQGTLIMFDVAKGQRVALSQPPAVWDFQWSH